MPSTQTNQKNKSAAQVCQPVRSMTGYGRAMLNSSRRVTAEIRAVNGRFLKLNIEIPKRYGLLEERIKKLLIDQDIKRGTVSVSIFFEGAGTEGNNFSIDGHALNRYLTQARALAKKNKLKGDISLNALLPLPGVIRCEEYNEELDEVWGRAREALLAAVIPFNQMRECEGAAMVADLRRQLNLLTAQHAVIRAAAPMALQSAMQKLKERLAKLLESQKLSGMLNAESLEREVALMADRTDISEELARLESHFGQMTSALADGGEVGKRLDFLTQELFRETNTIGSKAQAEQITRCVIEMKGLIEKIREQAQNLE
ncbi:MAG: YicC/YloC family endoribonuclease [Planctomycetota bacterium]